MFGLAADREQVWFKILVRNRLEVTERVAFSESMLVERVKLR